MTVCLYCDQEMLDSAGCTLSVFDDFPGGLVVGRVPYGNESEDWGAKSGRSCGDCGVPPGSFHHPSCDVERCPLCKGQALTCECANSEDENIEDVDEPVISDLMAAVDFTPLEVFFGSAEAPELDAFMFMGTQRDQYGELVCMYKHRDTRKYLFLDKKSVAYRNVDWDLTLVRTSRTTALAMVYDGIDEGLYLSSPGSMPRYEIFPMERNRPDVA